MFMGAKSGHPYVHRKVVYWRQRKKYSFLKDHLCLLLKAWEKYFISECAKQVDHLHLTVVHKDQVGTSYLVEPVLDSCPKACLLYRWDCACLYFHLCLPQECMFWMSVPPHSACYHIANHLGLHELVSWRCTLAAYGWPLPGTKPETVSSENLQMFGPKVVLTAIWVENKTEWFALWKLLFSSIACAGSWSCLTQIKIIDLTYI